MNNQDLVRSIIKSTRGLIFSIHFTTKKGEVRELRMKDGVESHKVHPKGVGSNRQEHCSNLITLFDMSAGKYKSIDLNNVYHIQCGGIVWNKGE